ncbi:MAG: hypothetical protein EBZ49_10835 [Proteobacteria bacterium]|nr:hypothetical protein [Pseudomonadota bacterium]
MIAQKELCQKWGYSPGQISRMVKRGMPLDSEASAMRWRLENMKMPKKHSIPVEPSPENQEEPESAGFSDEDISATSSLGRVLRAERIELSAAGSVAKALKTNNVFLRLTRLKKLFLNSSRKSVHYWMLCHLQSQPGQTPATQSVPKKLFKMQ